MKSPVLRQIEVFSMFLLLLAAGIPKAALAQWHNDSVQNTPVCTVSGAQDMPKGCTDGSDGAIITWEDARGSAYQIYAQHLDATGKATWTANGVKLAPTTSTYAQTMPIITTDDSGGAYIVWLDARFPSFGNCLFAQHIRADGTLAYDTALAVAVGLNGCANPTLCDDGRGGAYVAWEDNRATNLQTRPDIWMNRLWPGGVKFGLTTTGTGIETTADNYYNHTHHYTYFFHDPNAHFKSYMVNLHLNIVGKGSYLIATVASDTQLTLKSFQTAGTYSYWVDGLSGLPVDTFANKQTGPSITSDGTGGCYLAWTSSAAIPNSIYATRIDSTGTALWYPAPGPGFLVYKDQSTANPSKNVWINRDGTDLLLTWEVTNSGNNSQDVYGVRMHDSTFAWGAVNVSNQIDDQTLPRIYGDDSAMQTGSDSTRGVLVPFLDQEPGTSYVDVAMVRVMGTGGTLMPPTGSFWFFDQKPNTRSGMRTVKITDASNAGTATGVLAVWNDAWDGKDTMVYAQRMDRVGRRYFPTPTMGTSNRWGLAISGDSGTHPWTAKQVALIPRGNNGGIAVWTDLRNGNADIYAQLILGDGVANIPTDLEPPVSTILSQTGSYDSSVCNSRCTDVLVVDTGLLASGIRSIASGTMTNMKLTVPTPPSGKDSVAYNVCVIDSMLNGSAAVAVTDVAGNEKMENFTYCTIADILPPLVTWDSNSTWLRIHFTEKRPWDRGLDSILLIDSVNVSFTPALTALKPGAKTFDVTVTQINPALSSSFSIQGVDVAGDSSSVYSFAKTLADVSPSSSTPVSLSIFPNPTNGAALVTIQGAPAGDVSVYDVLGREVDHFHLEGSYNWQPSTLPPGTYYVRANIGGVIVSKSIVRE